MTVHAVSSNGDYAVVVCIDASGHYVIEQRRRTGHAAIADTGSPLFTSSTAAAAAKYVRRYLSERGRPVGPDSDETTGEHHLDSVQADEWARLPTCTDFLRAEMTRQEQEADTLERQVERDMLTQRIEAWDAMPSLSDADWAARRLARRRLAKLPKQNSKRLT